MHPYAKIVIPIVLMTVCLIVSCSIIIVGYLVPATQQQGYIPRMCTCGKSYIDNQVISSSRINRPNFVGTVDLRYEEIKDNVAVLTSTSYNIVKTYLQVNFKFNSTVVCYVSVGTKTIMVSHFSSVVAWAVCAAFTILAVVFFFITMICCCLKKFRRRSDYIELTRASPSSVGLTAS